MTHILIVDDHSVVRAGLASMLGSELGLLVARNHVNNILEKLQVSDRTEAVTTAIQQGLIAVAE